MSSKSLLATLTFGSTLFLLHAAFGQKATLQADVTGVDGRPAKTAEVRIERQDKKMAPLVAKTDKKGHLAATNLEAGTYKLTAAVEGGVKSSQIVKLQANKPSLVAFDMSKTSAVATKKKKKYVWVPAETGTSLGGHWAEVGDESAETGPSGRNVDTINGNSLEKSGRLSFGQAPAATGGR